MARVIIEGLLHGGSHAGYKRSAISHLACQLLACGRGRQGTVVCLQVDVWALGISAVEMAEVTPPRWSVHPMRVIFMISRDPPPRLADRDRWSLTFHDFVAQCLQKVSVAFAAHFDSRIISTEL